MNIVYSSSDYYADCTGVSLYSLYENNRDNDVNVFILSCGISELNKKRLSEISSNFNRTLTIIEANDGFEEAARLYNFEKLRGSYNTYSRIILNKWLSFLDKVIVIDSDTLVTGNLREMWETDLDNFYYAAVPEVSMYGRYNYFEEEEIINIHDTYYNAGICIVNLKQWREDNIDNYLLQCITKDSKSYLNSEQSIMNKFLGDKIKRIPLKYNYYTTFHFANFSVITRIFYKKHLINQDEYIEAKTNTAIIHYCGFSYERPWFSHSKAYKKDLYLAVRKKTPWKKEKLRAWGYRESKFKYVYDGLCYLMMFIGMYNVCLKFRLVFAQRIKGLLSKQ